MKSEYRITNRSGMGGVFNPPRHPEHTHHVETDLRKRRENRGGLSLLYSLELNYIPNAIKDEIKKLIDKWEKEKLPLNHPEVIEWVDSCKYHFGDEKAGDFICKFYPEYEIKAT
jgi:hypothetical protein